ncbi:hypothetical protein [Mucilaginibacter paludis]|uniref:DUF4834 domain-containing protein n=1 Tax=Mucilaginibacter paludis DSM 18603 TaxID=714943 RepID=H1YD89_9SPHI|nr:hypothetical protein [Mucilaginibacter paludis]EHQ27115.1 hypothetical protein Mucpa_3008 [Mucilaginibacter paludis DSM 18603]
MFVVEFLVILACVYYIIRLLIRLVLPMLFQGLVNKAQQHSQQQYSQPRPRHTDGSVRVDKIPQTKSSIPDSEGDYIDYEEIK